MRLSNQYYRWGQLRLEPACQWHWTRKAGHWNGHRHNHMAKKQTALNNHKDRNEWWQRTRRQRAGPTAVAVVGDAGRHGSRPSRSWRTRGGAGGETLAVTRGQPVGEWLSEMRGPRFGIWCACSCVGVCIIQPPLLGAPNNGGGKNLILREIERVSTESLNVTSSV